MALAGAALQEYFFFLSLDNKKYLRPVYRLRQVEFMNEDISEFCSDERCISGPKYLHLFKDDSAKTGTKNVFGWNFIAPPKTEKAIRC